MKRHFAIRVRDRPAAPFSSLRALNNVLGRRTPWLFPQACSVVVMARTYSRGLDVASACSRVFVPATRLNPADWGVGIQKTCTRVAGG